MVTTKEFSIAELKNLIREENLLPFNRKIAKKHVLKMMKSVEESDLIRDPLLGKMSYDNNKLAIVDGQHLISALVILSKDPKYKRIRCKVKDYTTKGQVIKDISKINNVQKTWKDENYLDAWYMFGPSGNPEYFPNYSHLWSRVNQGELPIGLIIDIYTSNKDAFKEGKLAFYDIQFSESIFSLLRDLRLEFNCSANMLYGVLLFAKEKRQTIDFYKLRSRLFDAMRNKTYSEREVSTRELFRDFVNHNYHKL